LANHKSAEKRARQAVKRSSRNSQNKASVKTVETRLTKAIDAKSKDVATLLSTYTKHAMSAVSKGVLKKETVSRKIGRLSKRVSALSAK